MAIVHQYVCFTSLVLHDVHSNSPIFPFDPSTGGNGNHAYHYHPAVTVKQLAGELGYCVSHLNDNDSRRICCIQCDDSELVSAPDLLTDAGTQGFAAWGGKLLTDSQALTLAQSLQPEHVVEWDDINPDDLGQPIHHTKTYGVISLDDDGYLTRTVVET